MKLFNLLLHKSNLVLTLSVIFFLASLIRQQRHYSALSSSTINLNEPQITLSLVTEESPPSNLPINNNASKISIKVYTGLYSHFHGERKITSLSHRLNQLLESSSLDSKYSFELSPMNLDSQFKFIKENQTICYKIQSDANDGNNNVLLNAYQQLVAKEHTKPIAQELWKFCALNYEQRKNDFDMVAYIDLDSPLLHNFDSILDEFFKDRRSSSISDGDIHSSRIPNIAVLGDALSPSTRNDNNEINTIHGSLLLVHSKNNNQRDTIAQDMLQTILSGLDEIIHDPLYMARQFHGSIVSSPVYRDDKNWMFLKQRCHTNPFQNDVQQQQKQRSLLLLGATEPSISSSVQTIINCPHDKIFCCDIVAPSGKAIMMTRHILLPYQLIPSTTNAGHYSSNNQYNPHDIPFITTIQEENTNARIKPYRNFFQHVFEKRCLPTSPMCEACMTRSEFNAGTCKGCAKYCGCFCDLLCKVDVKEKVVSKVLTGVLPRFRRDPTRRIPRIIHQTWFEHITREA